MSRVIRRFIAYKKVGRAKWYRVSDFWDGCNFDGTKARWRKVRPGLNDEDYTLIYIDRAKNT